MTETNIHNDKELFRKIADGDEESFSLLLKTKLPKLQAVILKLVKDPYATEEILQESFIRVWLNRDKMATIEKPEPWLKKVVLNETFTWLNKNAHRAQIFREPDDHVATEMRSDERLVLQETQFLLEKAIEEMPVQRKKIYIMSRVDGLRPDEIASKLKLSTGYVKNTLTAALDHLRTRLKEAGRFIWFW